MATSHHWQPQCMGCWPPYSRVGAAAQTWVALPHVHAGSGWVYYASRREGIVVALSDLGFSPLQEQVYRALLEQPDHSCTRLGQLAGVDEPAVLATLRSLVELGVLRACPAGTAQVTLVSPVVALGRLIEQAEDDLLRVQRRVGDTRSDVAELAARYVGAPGPSGAGIETITTLDRVREKLEELSFFTASTLRAVQPGGPQSPAALDASRPLDRRGLRRGIEMRIIYQASVLRDEANRAYLAEITAGGAQVRITSEPLNRMIIMDGRVTMVPIDPGDSSQGAVVVRQPSLVAGLITLFDRLWDAADPLPLLSPTAPSAAPARGTLGNPDLDELDRLVLGRLAGGDTDETVARAAGVSVRHLRRRIACLMRRLDASSRFEAGMAAAKRGWI